MRGGKRGLPIRGARPAVGDGRAFAWASPRRFKPLPGCFVDRSQAVAGTLRGRHRPTPSNGYTHGTLPVEGASTCAELWTRAGRSMLLSRPGAADVAAGWAST